MASKMSSMSFRWMPCSGLWPAARRWASLRDPFQGPLVPGAPTIWAFDGISFPDTAERRYADTSNPPPLQIGNGMMSEIGCRSRNTDSVARGDTCANGIPSWQAPIATTEPSLASGCGIPHK